MSLPEVLLWQRLRGKATGAKFRRQHRAGRYVLDFFCVELALAIEIDGAVHDDRQDSDEVRDRYLSEIGIKVVRIPASAVLSDPDSAASSIAALVAAPLHQPSAGPPPRSGEDPE